jgi:hypothetical protein
LIRQRPLHQRPLRHQQTAKPPMTVNMIVVDLMIYCANVTNVSRDSMLINAP